MIPIRHNKLRISRITSFIPISMTARQQREKIRAVQTLLMNMGFRSLPDVFLDMTRRLPNRRAKSLRVRNRATRNIDIEQYFRK
jgi:hypothetical protein